MVRVRVDEVVDASVEQVLSPVMDIERYARVAKKIRPEVRCAEQYLEQQRG